MIRPVLILLVLSLMTIAPASNARGAGPDPQGIEFFEQKIRPVLVEHCYQCHSAAAAKANKLKGGLRLDDRAGLKQGGDSGPAVEPGKVDESLIIETLRYDDATRMPPKGKLPEAVLADFEAWIKMGAPDPREGAHTPEKPKTLDLEAARKLWAYRLPAETPLPAVRDQDWPRTEIDRFLLARLEQAGLHPVADADRATLVRRLSFDLAGLPPTPEEIDAFVADTSPDAYERLVERLLASPRFGERWGRHWLDVARFGESLTLRGFIFPVAWRYRDYVIDALNADLPFDRFLREQVAGDLLPADDLDESRRQRVATAFLTLGNTNLEDQDKQQLRMDVVDEQIDTIGKAFLGQTIGCARCHDHKFDPIPTRDYYALAGILRNVKTLEHANVSMWLELPLPVPPEQERTYKQQEEAVAVLEAQIKQVRADLKAKGKPLLAGLGRAIPAKELPGIVVDDAQARRVGTWKESRFSGEYIGAGYVHDENAGKGEKTLTFQPELPEAGKYEVWLAYIAGPTRAAEVPVTIFSADGEKTVTVNMRATPPIEGRFVSLGRHQFERNGQGFVLISNEGTKGVVCPDAVLFLPPDMADRATVETSPEGKAKADTLKGMEKQLKVLKAAGPKREVAMSVVEESKIGDTQVHVRGNVHNLGENVPRGFLRVATYEAVPPFPTAESGRKELADWLASPRNPLTARVIANRAWHWLFGAGIVRTTDNFGTAGEPPSHPELLDHLARGFVADGWSVKALVRRIVLSRAYRLASVDDRRLVAADPENRLLGRANRRRLDAECLRDAILAVSGALRTEMGGPSFPADLKADYGYSDISTRRSVYVPAFRNALPEVFEVFDFADTSMVTGRRNTSTVAPQALYLMNNPFLMDQSRQAARRLRAEPGLDDGARVERAYRLALGRGPTEAERRIAGRFLADGSEERWALLIQALFGSLDFRYVN